MKKRVFELQGDVVSTKNGVATLVTKEFSPTNPENDREFRHEISGLGKELLSQIKKAGKAFIMGWVDTSGNGGDGKLIADSTMSKAIDDKNALYINNAEFIGRTWSKFMEFPRTAGKGALGNLVLEYSTPDGKPDGLFRGVVLNPADIAKYARTVKKGALVRMIGSIRTNGFKDNSGNERQKVEMLIEDAEILQPAVSQSALGDYNPEEAAATAESQEAV